MRSRSLRLATLLALSAVALLALAAPALAHTTVSADNTAAGGYAKLTFRVPHGCDGAATTVVRVQIPDGVVSVKPQVNPGWPDLSTEIGPLAEPYDNHGETITDGVREITWAGGELPDEFMDEFGVSVKLPEGEEGERLYFPAVQQCEENGGEEAWIEIPEDPDSDEELDYPAPYIELTAAEGDGHGGGEEATDEPTAADDEGADDEGASEAAGAAAPGPDGTTPVAAVSDSAGVEPAVWIAVVVGVVGLAVGAIGFRSGRRASAPPSHASTPSA